MKPSCTQTSRLIPIGFCLSLVLGCLTGCQSYTTHDAWRPIQIPKGLAWHNEACAQTAFDTNADGRVDRLRFWIGSGLAEEFIDDDLDGWFDRQVASVYGKDGDPKQIHREAPAAPVTNAAGSFERPRDL
ncbi:MAG: hypothetical protein QM760_03625 [Nibricoccus sp.]